MLPRQRTSLTARVAAEQRLVQILAMPDTQETCPLCGSSVVVRKVDGETAIVFPDHDGCGPFATTLRQILRLRMKGAEPERDRLGAKVRADKAKGKKPPTI